MNGGAEERLAYRQQPMGIIEAHRNVAARLATFVEVNRGAWRGLERLVAVSKQIVELQLRVWHVAAQLTSIPLYVAQAMLGFFDFVRFGLTGTPFRSFLLTTATTTTAAAAARPTTYAHRGHENNRRASPSSQSLRPVVGLTTDVIQSAIAALQIPLKLLVLPLAILEVPFRAFASSAHTSSSRSSDGSGTITRSEISAPLPVYTYLETEL